MRLAKAVATPLLRSKVGLASRIRTLAPAVARRQPISAPATPEPTMATSQSYVGSCTDMGLSFLWDGVYSFVTRGSERGGSAQPPKALQTAQGGVYMACQAVNP